MRVECGRRSRPSIAARDRARRARRAAFPHTHRCNVCPSRFLLRRPRRRLQGDQDPSAYFLAFARRATTRGTTTRARDATRARRTNERTIGRSIAVGDRARRPRAGGVARTGAGRRAVDAGNVSRASRDVGGRGVGRGRRARDAGDRAGRRARDTVSLLSPRMGVGTSREPRKRGSGGEQTF